ncbi:MAG: hypothetical protein OEY88_06070, partial [Candidatus Bathyarchaeota archaeon]|nr:hypothetical protein [Candidatus Bathyarchaeota archaeon]
MRRVTDTQLLLLATSYLQKIEGRKRFQKIIFLLKEQFGIEFKYRFTSYLYGPYSAQLQDDIDILVRTSYLKVSKISYLYFYEITPLGQKSASQIEKEYGEDRARKLQKHASGMEDLDTEELVGWSKQL